MYHLCFFLLKLFKVSFGIKGQSWRVFFLNDVLTAFKQSYFQITLHKLAKKKMYEIKKFAALVSTRLHRTTIINSPYDIL